MTPTPDERRDDRYEIENKEIQSLLRDVAKRIGADMPDGWGFTLFLFSYDAPPDNSLFYISSANREDMRKAIQEWLAMEEERHRGRKH